MTTPVPMISRLVAALILLLPLAAFSQSSHPALDSMGINMGRQNWKAALHWAIVAAEANPAEKNWRYLNAAEFASRDKNREVALRYLTLVVDSEIGAQAGYGAGFDWLRTDPEWKKLMTRVDARREEIRQGKIKASLPFRAYQQQLRQQVTPFLDSLARIISAEAMYQKIKETRPRHRYTRNGRYVYAWIKFADTLDVPYLIQLPPNFDAARSYPLLVVLHGAVLRQTGIADVPDSTQTFFGQMFMRQAADNGCIAIFPYSNKRYNWMMPDDGFGIVPQMVRETKQMFAIDDSRVYVTGHSNGATGAFSYLMKQPGLFAGFSGINNRPQVRTGGTFFRNAANRSFHNVATDYDYYFPFEGHQAVKEMAREAGVDWQNEEVTGRRQHGYLISNKDSTTQQIYRRLFDSMLAKRRNPFQNRLYWECDDTRNGRCDWLEIVKLDTLRAPESWQKRLNVTVTGWRDMMNPAIRLDSLSDAFEFPRRSGAVQAVYSKNRFELTASRTGKVRIYLSPEMVDFRRNVKVIINGKTVYNEPAAMDRIFILDQYRRETDRQALWVNALEFEIPDSGLSKTGR